MTEASHMPQQVNSAHQRHLDVGNHTGRLCQFRSAQELLRGGKGVDQVSVRCQKVARGAANGWIIVDD